MRLGNSGSNAFMAAQNSIYVIVVVMPVWRLKTAYRLGGIVGEAFMACCWTSCVVVAHGDAYLTHMWRVSLMIVRAVVSFKGAVVLLRT